MDFFENRFMMIFPCRRIDCFTYKLWIAAGIFYKKIETEFTRFTSIFSTPARGKAIFLQPRGFKSLDGKIQ
jgi:hypothetical protein